MNEDGNVNPGMSDRPSGLTVNGVSSGKCEAGMLIGVWIVNRVPFQGFLSFESGRPGAVAATSAKALWFQGWLGFLKVLSDLVDREGEAT